MAKYEITDEATGRKFIIEGDSMPTAQDIEEITSQFGGVELSGSEMLRNAPESAMNLVKDIGTAVLNPIDTVHNMGRMVDGVLDKGGINIPGTEDNEGVADAVGDALYQRYGTWDNTKRTMNTDPVGALSDIAGIATGGAGLAAKTGLTGAKTVAKAATILDPANLATRGVANALRVPAKAALRNVDEGLKYAEGMKLPPGLDGKNPGTRSRLGKTALKYDISPDADGFARLKALQDDFDVAIDSVITEAGAQGTKLNSNVLKRRLRELRQKRLDNPNLEAKGDVSIIDGFIEKVDAEQARTGRIGWTPEEMQAFKRNTYAQTEYGIEMTGEKAMRNDARKAVARGAKDTLESLGGEVKELNAEWSRLLELEKPLSQASARLGNNNPIPMDAMISVGAGGGVDGARGAAIFGAVRHMLNSPANRRRLAKLVHHIKDGGPSLQGSVDATLLRYATTLAGRSNEELEEMGLWEP